jgi:signal transduction histidine kinase
MTDLLLDSPMSGEQEEYAETVRRSAEHLLSLVDDILDLSKLEAGKVELESVPFDLREMMEDLVTEAAVRGREKGLDTVFSVDPSIPSILRATRAYPADTGQPSRERREVHALGHVRLDVSPVEPDSRDSCSALPVSDTGIGVSENKPAYPLSALFPRGILPRPGVRGDGLGLSICRGLAEAMGGSLE